MKRMTKRILPVLALSLIMMTAMSSSVLAESSKYEGLCTFADGRMISSFSSKEVASAIENLQPGDDVTFTVEYKNGYDGTTDWYMENSIVKTLEKTDQARKQVSGTGSAENGGYTYELIQYDKDNKKNVLFSNAEVGGEKKVTDLEDSSKELEGLEPATNALDEWFFIDTLEEGESGEVVLHVAFDGETEVNDYMDTDGELNVRFAVELPENNPPGTPPDTPHKRVKTGDQSRLLMWASIGLVSGLLMLCLAFLSRKKDERMQTAGEGEGTRYKNERGRK